MGGIHSLMMLILFSSCIVFDQKGRIDCWEDCRRRQRPRFAYKAAVVSCLPSVIPLQWRLLAPRSSKNSCIRLREKRSCRGWIFRSRLSDRCPRNRTQPVLLKHRSDRRPTVACRQLSKARRHADWTRLRPWLHLQAWPSGYGARAWEGFCAGCIFPSPAASSPASCCRPSMGETRQAPSKCLGRVCVRRIRCRSF